MAIDGFVPFYRLNVIGALSPLEAAAQYYEHATNAKPYSKPKTAHFKKVARAIFIILDTLEGRPPSSKYVYGVRKIPGIYSKDILYYEGWLIENGFAQAIVTNTARQDKSVSDCYC